MIEATSGLGEDISTMKVREAAQNLFDNRLGWSNGRSPYAPREFWYELGLALYGKDDNRVQELGENKKGFPSIEDVHGILKDNPTGNERPVPV